MFARRMIVLGLVAVFSSVPAWALEIGDTAPPLKIKKWIKGDKVKLKDLKGKEIVVIEFWATWCRPCRKSIPHLTELQAKYKKHGVRVIGVSTEDSSTVLNFVEGMGKKMDYTVAVDNGGKTSASLMQEFNVQGIPHAFIIDRKGKIVWHGHPLDEEFEEEIEDLVRDQPVPVNKHMKKAKRLRKEYFKLARSNEVARDEFKQVGEQMIKHGAKDKKFLVGVVSRIIKSKKIKHRDVALALKGVDKAYELTEGKDCDVNALYGRVMYEKGDLKGSLKYMREALAVCEDFDHEDKLEKRIGSLRKAIKEKKGQ